MHWRAPNPFLPSASSWDIVRKKQTKELRNKPLDIISGKMTTEADTCRTYVVPKLHAAGWEDEQIREQVTFTDGRIVPFGGKATRKKQKRAD